VDGWGGWTRRGPPIKIPLRFVGDVIKEEERTITDSNHTNVYKVHDTKNDSDDRRVAITIGGVTRSGEAKRTEKRQQEQEEEIKIKIG